MERKSNVLAMIYELNRTNKTDDALDMLYEVVDDLLHAGSFVLCDRMLAKLEVNALSEDLLVGALSITLTAKNSLPARAQLFGRVQQKLALTHNTDEVTRLLDGLG
jgi:hypothetical protein